MTSTLVLNAFLPFQHRLLCILLSLEDNFMYIISFSRKVSQFSSLDRTFCFCSHSLVFLLSIAVLQSTPKFIDLNTNDITSYDFVCVWVCVWLIRWLFCFMWSWLRSWDSWKVTGLAYRAGHLLGAQLGLLAKGLVYPPHGPPGWWASSQNDNWILRKCIPGGLVSLCKSSSNLCLCHVRDVPKSKLIIWPDQCQRGREVY